MKSTDFCEATLHALPSQLCVLDANGVIIFVNAAWRRFADDNPPAPANYSLHENYIAVCDRATGENAAEARPFADGIRSILSGEASHFELTYPCHAPGTKRWFLGRVAPMPVLGQTGVVITHTEITAHRLASEALRNTEQRYRALFELSGTGIVIIDRDGRYLMVNRKAAELFGSPPDKIVGKSIFDFFSETVTREYLTQNREVIDSGIGRDYEASFHLASGDRTFLICDRSIVDEEGRGVALQSSSVDITDRKRMQDNLRALAGHLQSAREDERRFIAREIHDHFSQVLSALKIDLVLMMKEQQQGEANDPANRIAEQLGSIDATLESVILDLRHLVTQLRPEMLESVGIVATMAYEVSQFQKRTGLLTHFITNKKELELDMDSSLALYRILQEALANVRRHAHAKTVTVRCECSEGSLTLQIEDDGRGFPKSPPADAIPYGILSMRERASLLKGDLSIVRTPAHTTIVEVHIPLSRPSVKEPT
jgi:PAS domain S-box-containing protein